MGDVSTSDGQGRYSGEFRTSDLNMILGVPTAAKRLGFQEGYDQVYANDSAPTNVDKSIELDLLRFDSPANASKFVQQMDRRSIGSVGNPRNTPNVVTGVPGALSVDDTVKEDHGLYQHSIIAFKDNVAFMLWFSDFTRGPSAFLRTLAAQEYAML